MYLDSRTSLRSFKILTNLGKIDFLKFFLKNKKSFDLKWPYKHSLQDDTVRLKNSLQDNGSTFLVYNVVDVNWLLKKKAFLS